TNFYAEMGGQVGDSGTLHLSPSPGTPGEGRGEGAFDVQSTQTIANYTLHIGRLTNGKLRVGDTITATVEKSRAQTQKNHTTTHIANWALREVLGEGVQQKGSLVDPEKLRFDFSHNKAMTDEEIEKVETLVNREIQKNLNVYAQIAPQEKALK